MRGSGRDPTRRNRNLGTSKSGHGLANRLVIPDSWNDPRVYWEKLRSPVTIELNGFTIFVEPCSPGFVHAVTVDDVLRVVGLIPRRDIAQVRIVALRQPTRKQRILACVWGRLAYFAEFGPIRGPAVIIEAQPRDGSFDWSSSLTPDAAYELECLRADGHQVIRERRHWKIQSTLAAVRNTQLFRTLPHELGHYVQYDRNVRIPAQGDIDAETRLQDIYFAKPGREKEAFAHRYAREFYEKMAKQGKLPFDRLVDRVGMKRFGLDDA